MIVATAGHVDHGKTSLIRCLTGVETDTLAEEKQRGLSINLGYAYLPRDGGIPLGFIDVPGHSRFINTMISGISGIDLGLLVIAADDGPMPQTREHLDVLQLLGVRRLVVAVSKVDRVEPARVAEVSNLIRTLLATRGWTDATIFPVSNITGAGIAEITAYLLQQADHCRKRDSDGYFRFTIDRAFNLKGTGLVVTGTASAGTVKVGDSLMLQPGALKARVRSLRAHDEAVETAAAGQRCALNLTGEVSLGDISRGDWLLQATDAPIARRVDVEFSMLADAPFVLKHQSPVKLYIGARRIAARLALVHTAQASNRLLPGEQCLAQLLLDSDIACVQGERFLLRDHAEDVILGGGRILDPAAAKAGRSRKYHLDYLQSMRAATAPKALAALLQQGRPVNLSSFAAAWNRDIDHCTAVLAQGSETFTDESITWAASADLWRKVNASLVGRVQAWHLENPCEAGVRAPLLRAQLLQDWDSALAVAVMAAQLRAGTLRLIDGCIALAKFRPTKNTEDESRWQRLRVYLQQRGKHIPLLSEIATETGLSVEVVAGTAEAARKRGELFRVSARRYAQAAVLRELTAEILAQDEAGASLTVVALKNSFGTGRNLTVEILEFFDQVRFTRRQGESRVILDRELPGSLFSG